eukprot:3011732-Pyramimonas_sp.AAC.1
MSWTAPRGVGARPSTQLLAASPATVSDLRSAQDVVTCVTSCPEACEPCKTRFRIGSLFIYDICRPSPSLGVSRVPLGGSLD